MESKKICYTRQGYSYVKCNENDCYNWGGASICDRCNSKMHGEVYLVYVLGMAYCRNCFEEWQERSKRYEDDIILQTNNHLRWYKCHKLNIEE